MAVSKRLRYEIFRRDSHSCRYCGATAPDVPLRIDHVTPVALGGADTPDNLVTACEPCNSGKSSASPDAHHVANVSDDAVRWAEAMKQAAAEAEAEEGPKLAYRQAFLDAWNDWTYESMGNRKTFDLPDDWRSSVERYRVAGIPASSWADLIEPGMVNRTVKGPDVFRYTCGVANNRLKQLAERASQIVGASFVPAMSTDSDTDPVRRAALSVWRVGMTDNVEAPTAEQADDFRQSLEQMTDWDLLQPGRIIEAAQHATYFEITDIGEAMRDLDRANVWSAWISAWPKTYIPPADDEDPWGGRYTGGPSDGAMALVREKIKKLLDGGASAFRVAQAATYACFNKSTRIYRGLTEEELDASGEASWVARTLELWRSAFVASSQREPSEDEIAQVIAILRRIGADEGFYIVDAQAAASAAGAYQDPDISTCLPRHLSVFEIAARPLAPAA